MKPQFVEVFSLPCCGMVQQPRGPPRVMTPSKLASHKSPVKEGGIPLGVQIRSGVMGCDPDLLALQPELFPGCGAAFLWHHSQEEDTGHSWAHQPQARSQDLRGGCAGPACGLTAFSILTESSISAQPRGLCLLAKAVPPVLWRRSGV